MVLSLMRYNYTGAITPYPSADQIACQGAKAILLNTVSCSLFRT